MYSEVHSMTVYRDLLSLFLFIATKYFSCRCITVYLPSPLLMNTWVVPKHLLSLRVL